MKVEVSSLKFLYLDWSKLVVPSCLTQNMLSIKLFLCKSFITARQITCTLRPVGVNVDESCKDYWKPMMWLTPAKSYR